MYKGDRPRESGLKKAGGVLVSVGKRLKSVECKTLNIDNIWYDQFIISGGKFIMIKQCILVILLNYF